ncbi:MAG TPA: fasciclin domain-containing protein [Candidatus Saccharimonadales bacterium]|jgi:uncharacterized surface protein with fasciclin (FAS1) repeats
MQTSKAVIIGVIVLVVGAVVGLSLFNMNKDDMSTASKSSTTPAAQTAQSEDKPMADKTITELAVATPDLSTLVTAVQAAGLAETLGDKNAKLTVFAPTNAAFGKLPAGTVETLVKPESKEMLTSILTYHVVPAVAMAADLKDGQKIKTVQGAELTVKLQDNKVWIVDAKGGMAQVTTADVKASNGVVHIIDSVLMY